MGCWQDLRQILRKIAAGAKGTAVADTAKSVGIKGEPTLVHPERDRKTLMDLLLGDVSQFLPGREKMLEQQVGFYYLWK